MKRTKLQIDIIYRKDISMRKYHKVEIKRKDLYSKDYSKTKYFNTRKEDRKISYVNKGIVDVLVKMIEDFD